MICSLTIAIRHRIMRYTCKLQGHNLHNTDTIDTLSVLIVNVSMHSSEAVQATPFNQWCSHAMLKLPRQAKGGLGYLDIWCFSLVNQPYS